MIKVDIADFDFDDSKVKEKLEELNEAIQQNGILIEKGRKTLATLGNGYKDVSKELEELKKANKSDTEEYKEKIKSRDEFLRRIVQEKGYISELTKEIAVNRKERAELTSFVENETVAKKVLQKGYEEEAKSIEGIRELRKSLIDVRNKELAQDGEQTDKGKALNQVIEDLTNLEKGLVSETEKRFYQIGDYAGQLGGKFENLSKVIQQINNNEAVKTSDVKKAKEELSKVREQEIGLIKKSTTATGEELKNIISENENIKKLDTQFQLLNQREKFGNLRTELKDLVSQLAGLKAIGQDNTVAYEKLRKKAIELRSAISTVNSEVSKASSTTRGLDTLVNTATALTSTFSIAQGVTALFGEKNEDLQKSLLHVTAVISILNGLQQIQTELKKKDNAITIIQTGLQKAYAVAVGTSTGALKLFRIALAGTGIGFFIILIAEAISNFKTLSEVIGINSQELQKNLEIAKKANEIYGDKIVRLKSLIEQNKGVTKTEREKREAVKDFNSEFSSTLGAVKDYEELEKRIIRNAPKYVQYMQIKAQAEASHLISLEKQKKLLEQITALSIGDIKWYEKLLRASDKLFEKGWEFIGVNTGKKLKTNISQDEVMSILGLPSNKERDKALEQYSQDIRLKIKQLAKENANALESSKLAFDLQKKASSLADSLNLKDDSKPNEDSSKKIKEQAKKDLNELLRLREKFKETLASISFATAQEELNNQIKNSERVLKNSKIFSEELLREEQDRLDKINALKKKEIQNDYSNEQRKIEQGFKKDLEAIKKIGASQKVKADLEKEALEVKNKSLLKIEQKHTQDLLENQQDYLAKKEELEKTLNALRVKNLAFDLQLEIDTLKNHNATTYDIKKAELDKENTLALEKLEEQYKAKEISEEQYKQALLNQEERHQKNLQLLKADTDAEDNERIFDNEINRLITQGAEKYDILKAQLEKESQAKRDQAQRDLIAGKINAEEFSNTILRINTEEAEKLKQIELEKQKEKIDIISQGLDGISDLLGKETMASKGILAAKALMNSWLAVTEIWKNPTSLPEPFGTIQKVGATATALASALNAVKQIKAVNVHGGGGSATTTVVNNYKADYAGGVLKAKDNKNDKLSAYNEGTIFNSNKLVEDIKQGVIQGSSEGSKRGSSEGSKAGVFQLSQNSTTKEKSLV